MTDISFEKGTRKVNLNFSEFDSPQAAYDAYGTPRSVGEGRKLDGYGDEGEKVYLEGTFLLLRFRRGNVIVTIGGADEKTALLFAGYARDAIAGR